LGVLFAAVEEQYGFSLKLAVLGERLYGDQTSGSIKQLLVQGLRRATATKKTGILDRVTQRKSRLRKLARKLSGLL
jgi:hypothetical protein